MPFKFRNIIKVIKHKEHSHIWDVVINDINTVRAFDSIECHLIIYPYSRKITANSFTVSPFEEYAKEISKNQKSAYVKAKSHMNEVVGLLLGLIIGILFATYNSKGILSADVIVAMLGVYIIGKELWGDVERILIDISKEWRIRYQANYYSFNLEKHTTLTQYMMFAKQHRYSRATVLPKKMDYIEQANSITLRTFFEKKDFKYIQNNMAHLCSIDLGSIDTDTFEKNGFLFAIKLTFSKKKLFHNKSLELFQSVHKNKKGCLDAKGIWIDNAVYYKNTIQCKRVNYFSSKGIIHNENVLEFV